MSGKYRYLAAQLAWPGALLAELPLGDVFWETRLLAAGEFKANLKLPPPTNFKARRLASLWKSSTDRATTCIYVLRDSTPLACFVVWVQDYDSDTQTISLNGAELTSYFRRRIIEGATLSTPVKFTAQPAMDIAESLVSGINDIGLLFDTEGAGSTGSLTKTYVGLDNVTVGDEVLALAMGVNGFDYRMDIRTDQNGNLQRYFVARPFLGGSTEIVAKYGTNVARLQPRRQGDIRTNDALVMGLGADDARPSARATSTVWLPKMTSILSLGDETGTSNLSSQAQGMLAAQLNHEVIEVDVVNSPDAEVGTFHPGDTMRLIVPPNKDPWFADGFDGGVRIVGFGVKVPDEGGREVVTMYFEDVNGA